MPVTPDAIGEMLRPYYESDDARDVAVALLNAIVATESVMIGETGREVVAGVGRMLTDFAFGLGGNPFWQRHAASIMPVFSSAVIARFDSYEHALERHRGQVDNVAHITARQVAAEVAVHVLFCEQGTRGVRSGSVAMRRDLLEKIGGIHNAG